MARSQEYKDRAARIDELGIEWNQAQGDENKAARQKIELEIFTLYLKNNGIDLDSINELNSKQADTLSVLAEVYGNFSGYRIDSKKDKKTGEYLPLTHERELKPFDASKGKLSTFLDAHRNFRSKDESKKRDHKKEIKDKTDGETKEIQMERSIDADGIPLPSTEIEYIPEEDDSNDSLYIFISIMLEFSNRVGKSSKNFKRQDYFRMFFTEDCTFFIRNEKDVSPYLKHERDLFRAMKLPFLDFITEKVCRSIFELEVAVLKPYGVLVEGRDMKSCEQPLPQDVYLSYLERVENYEVGASAISQQHKAYKEFIWEKLC